MILTPLPSAARNAGRKTTIYSDSWYFQSIRRFVPDCSANGVYHGRNLIAADVLQRDYDLGNGHFIQRLHRAIGLEPPLKPQGILGVTGEKMRGRVALHFEPGRHAAWQRDHVHARAREIYPGTTAELQRFINGHSELEFLEIGNRPSGLLQGVDNKTGLPLHETLELLRSCEWFIGIMSGPMHLATALNCKCIVIINFPDPTQIFLPTLKDIDQVESEWFYPQNVHLHQEGEGRQVKQFSQYNLERAFNGEVYPYWSDIYLPLIDERPGIVHRSASANASPVIGLSNS
jgi:hypothetical protein